MVDPRLRFRSMDAKMRRAAGIDEGTHVTLQPGSGQKVGLTGATMEAGRRLTFGDFGLDLTSGRLWYRDEVAALTPKAFAVLRRLVEDRGQLVSKEELLRAGWAKTHVSEGVLKVIILEIRRALGDDPAAPSFIETVPRRGYRFIGPRARQAKGPAVVDPRGALVGRDSVLAQLEDRLASALAGERQLVFLSGEAGIGKTTVLDALLARAAFEPDLLIARGACLEHYGAAEAYQTVLEAFGRLLREPGGERVIRILRTHAPTWLMQLPWLEQRDDRESLRGHLLGVTNERMLREMAEALEALSAVIPVLLVLEDPGADHHRASAGSPEGTPHWRRGNTTTRCRASPKCSTRREPRSSSSIGTGA